jgi:hypothetical protein
MVLMMVMQEAGPCERWPTMLKGKLETTSGSQGTQLENWHSNSLKRFSLLFLRVRKRGEMKLLMMKKMMMMMW